MKNSLLLVLVIPFIASGCTMAGMAAGAGATAGISAAQEGGISGAWSDAKIQTQINDLWFRYSVEAFSKLDMTVKQGRVLITGVVQDPEQRVEAVRLAWQPKGVKQVINEIRVAESDGIIGFARDSWITTRLRTALTFDRDVLSINYTIDTVQGTVYLMGIAQNQTELNRVIETARTIPDVKRVVSYVKIRTEEPAKAPVENYSDPAAPSGQDSYDYNNSYQGQDSYDTQSYQQQDYYGGDTGQPQPLVRQGNAPAPIEREVIPESY